MMKKVLITGINGLLGQNLVKEFVGDHRVIGIDLGPSIFAHGSGVTVESMDLTDSEALRHHLDLAQPDFLVHGAAYTNVDGAEDQSELAFKVNYEVPKILAALCHEREIPLIHISTDYVFNGQSGPYRESDSCDPKGSYSQSKYAGERAVLDSAGQHAVIRPNVLYGHGTALKSSFVGWLLGELQNGHEVRIVDDQFNNPSYARRLASLIRTIIETEAWDVWHFGSKEVISRYDFSLKIADTFGLSSQLIHAISTVDLNQKAPRPLRSGLICDKVHQELGVPILSVQEELTLLKEEINAP